MTKQEITKQESCYSYAISLKQGRGKITSCSDVTDSLFLNCMALSATGLPVPETREILCQKIVRNFRFSVNDPANSLNKSQS